MCILAEFFRDQPQQAVLDLDYVFTGRDTGPVGDPEDVRINRDGGMPECRVENHVGGFPADTGQGLEGGTVFRDLPVMLFSQDGAGSDDIFCLGVEQADRFYIFPEAGFSQFEHGLRCFHLSE